MTYFQLCAEVNTVLFKHFMYYIILFSRIIGGGVPLLYLHPQVTMFLHTQSSTTSQRFNLLC